MQSSFSLAVLSLSVASAMEPLLTKEELLSVPLTPSEGGEGDMQWLSLEHDGVERTYYVYTPLSVNNTDPSTVPLVVDVHPFITSAHLQYFLSGLHELADEHGFMIAGPDATGVWKGLPFPLQILGGSWNTNMLPFGADDVGFIRSMLQEVFESHPTIDRRRVYHQGMSQGGMMGANAVCHLSDIITAVSMTAGGSGLQGCPGGNFHRDVPVLMFRGSRDFFSGARDLVSDLLTMSNCTDTIDDGTAEFTNGAVECVSYGEQCGIRQSHTGGSNVTLCHIQDGGHTWPAYDPTTIGRFIWDEASGDVDCTTQNWDFFQKYAFADFPEWPLYDPHEQ